MFLGVFFIGVAIVYFLRHLFGVKYPMLKSSTIISIPALEAGAFINTWGLALMAFEHLLIYGGIDPKGPLAIIQLLALIYALFGTVYIVLKMQKLFYATFNFNQYESSDLKGDFGKIKYALLIQLILFIAFTLVVTPVRHISEYYFGIFFNGIISTIVLIYIFNHCGQYEESIDELYNDEYSSSIEATVVKGIQTVIPNEIRNIGKNNTQIRETKVCPYCGEEILATAKKCRYCGEWLEDEKEVKKQVKEAKENETLTSDLKIDDKSETEVKQVLKENPVETKTEEPDNTEEDYKMSLQELREEVEEEERQEFNNKIRKFVIIIAIIIIVWGLKTCSFI